MDFNFDGHVDYIDLADYLSARTCPFLGILRLDLADPADSLPDKMLPLRVGLFAGE